MVNPTGGIYYENKETGVVQDNEPMEMSGWMKKRDDESGRDYYYNTKTGVYQWSAPDPKILSRSVKSCINTLLHSD